MNTTTAASGADDMTRAIACALAKIDGYDPEDLNCGLYELRWSGGPNPEPEGDAWHMDYLPKAEKIAATIASAAAQGTVLAAPAADALDAFEQRMIDWAQADALDAKRWRMLPAFIQDHQIDYLRLLRDIDAAIAAQAKAQEGA